MFVAMQNGGLASYVANPFSLLSGGRISTTNSAQGTSQGISIKANQGPSSITASSRTSAADAYSGLNKSQINALWGLGVPSTTNTGLRPGSGGSSSSIFPASASRLGMSMHNNLQMSGPYAGAYGGLMPGAGGYPR